MRPGTREKKNNSTARLLLGLLGAQCANHSGINSNSISRQALNSQAFKPVKNCTIVFLAGHRSIVKSSVARAITVSAVNWPTSKPTVPPFLLVSTPGTKQAPQLILFDQKHLIQVHAHGLRALQVLLQLFF